jgi:hypothetical protein
MILILRQEAHIVIIIFKIPKPTSSSTVQQGFKVYVDSDACTAVCDTVRVAALDDYK